MCRTCNITPPDAEKLRADLEDIAAIYRSEKSKYDDIPSNADVTRELNSVAKHAGRLIASLDSLNWRARQTIHEGVFSDGDAAILGKGAAPDIPSMVISLSLTDGNDSFLEMDLPPLLAVLRGLENAALDGKTNVQNAAPGQNRAFGLPVWTSNIASVWVEISQQPFRRDVTNDGEPITNAARFCVAAFKFVDPDMPSSRVLSAMKNRIQRHRKSTGRISVQNES